MASTKQKEWELNREEFDSFLEWLEKNQNLAAEKYETIRNRLIAYFKHHCPGCPDPESLADETINRIIRKLPTFADSYVGDKEKIFYAYANFVRLEYLRKRANNENSVINFVSLINYLQSQNQSELDAELDRTYHCLSICLQEHPPDKQKLFISYYLVEKSNKVNHHEKLAEEFGLSLSALRKKIFDMKQKLLDCIKNCLKK